MAAKVVPKLRVVPDRDDFSLKNPYGRELELWDQIDAGVERLKAHIAKLRKVH